MGTQGAEKGQYKFHFNIGSIDSFERKMEEAQEDLGWGTDSFVPITYTNELSWQQVCCCSYLKPSFGVICLHHCKPVPTGVTHRLLGRTPSGNILTRIDCQGTAPIRK